MKKQLVAMAVAVLVAALAMSGAALAEGAGGKGMKAGNGPGGGMGMCMGMGMMGMGPGAGMGLERLLNNPQFIMQLGLSDAQVKKLKDIQSKAQRDGIKTRAEVDTLQLDLKDELDRDDPDINKVDSLLDKIGAKHTEMQKNTIHTMVEMKDALTPEQKEKAKALLAEKMKDRGGKKGGKQGNRSQGMGPGGPGMGQGGGPWGAPPEDAE